MKKTLSASLLTVALLGACFTLAASSPATGSPGGVKVASTTAQSKLARGDRAVCGPATAKRATCLAIRHATSTPTSGLVRPLVGVSYGANQLRKAYSIRALGSRSRVIAIIDAYHSGTAFDDLTMYREMFNLGPMDNCGQPNTRPTSVPAGKNPCFLQLTQSGEVATASTTEASGWAQETALDIEMAAAFCPKCSILLVEAKLASFKSLEAAVATASRFKGVKAISNSYGGSDANEQDYPAYAAASELGIAVTASSGDSGYGVSSPASFSTVVAVGGTSLYLDARGSYSREAAWASGGSGCSTLNPAANWQDSALTDCLGKSAADVAAVADPATGVTVAYDSNWMVFGGTSVSSPIIAALYALKADFGDSAGDFTASQADQLHDVSRGSNGSCQRKIWCNAGLGWDGPTGFGSPNGGGAF